MVRVQLANGGEFEQDSKRPTCKQFEHVACPMLPRVEEAERELDVDDEFEENEIGVGHCAIINVLREVRRTIRLDLVY